MLYDTESAKKVFTDEASLEYIALGRVSGTECSSAVEQ